MSETRRGRCEGAVSVNTCTKSTLTTIDTHVSSSSVLVSSQPHSTSAEWETQLVRAHLFQDCHVKILLTCHIMFPRKHKCSRFPLEVTRGSSSRARVRFHLGMVGLRDEEKAKCMRVRESTRVSVFTHRKLTRARELELRIETLCVSWVCVCVVCGQV